MRIEGSLPHFSTSTDQMFPNRAWGFNDWIISTLHLSGHQVVLKVMALMLSWWHRKFSTQAAANVCKVWQSLNRSYPSSISVNICSLSAGQIKNSHNNFPEQSKTDKTPPHTPPRKISLHSTTITTNERRAPTSSHNFFSS